MPWITYYAPTGDITHHPTEAAALEHLHERLKFDRRQAITEGWNSEIKNSYIARVTHSVCLVNITQQTLDLSALDRDAMIFEKAGMR